LQNAAKVTFLKPYKLGIASEKEHIEAISVALATFGESVRESIEKSDDIDDPTTADLFTQISRGVDQQLWFIESHNH
jgi:starvation-inducible DNA-binding protein